MKKVELSILFGDIQGYTSLSEKLAPNVIQKLLEKFFSEMSRIVSGHKGIIDKIMGDGMMVLFESIEGEPGHAERSVATALEMQKKAEELRPFWQAAALGADLKIRVGIATGPVTFSELYLQNQGASSVVGSAVNLAAHLQRKAPPGGVLVSHRTRYEMGYSYPCLEVPGIEVRGYDDALTAYLVEFESGDGQKGIEKANNKAISEGAVYPYKRKFPRRKLTMDIEYTTGGNTVRRKSLNISEGGILIATDSPEPVGSEVVIFSSIPTSRGILPIRIRGRVVRISDGKGPDGMGVEFSAVESRDQETTTQLVSRIFGFPLVEESVDRELPDDQEKSLPAFPKRPVFNGRALPYKFDELGSEKPEGIFRKMIHEFKRTKRYGREFTCVAVKIEPTGESLDIEMECEALKKIAAAATSTIRTTDEMAYIGDGLFFILAPETMPNRAATLARRVVERVHFCLQGLPEEYPELNVRTGTFSFNGWNASSPEDVMGKTIYATSP